MTKFTKTIKREIVLESAIKGFPSASWILHIGLRGIAAHKKGHSTLRRITWRQLLAVLLIHAPEVDRDELGAFSERDTNGGAA